MSFNWKAFIDFAKELMDATDEARLRSAISRAYYGVFCIARNKKRLKEYKKKDVHSKVIESYKSSQDKDEKFIGKTLDELRRHRNDADYNEDKKITPALARRSVLKAVRILTKL